MDMLEEYKQLVGYRFSRLTILEVFRTKDEKIKQNKIRAICKCDCGIITKPLPLYPITKWLIKSCGCLRNEVSATRFKLMNAPKLNKSLNEISEAIINKIKINKLTIIGVAKSGGSETLVQCMCDCGNITNIRRSQFFSGNTKSCGCILNDKDFQKNNRTQEPHITSAKAIFCGYKDGDLTFEQFLELVKKDCYYCGAPPNNNFNAFKYKKNRVSKYALEAGSFIYNGLDRIDTAKPHNFNNVVPCCHPCNFAKSDRTIKEFAEWVIKLQNWAHQFLEDK